MHNLLSISQFCDKGCDVLFKKEKSLITNQKNERLALNGVRKGDLFVADWNSAEDGQVMCFYSKTSVNGNWLWHRKFSHLNFKTMNSLVKRELVSGLPEMEFSPEELCEACEKGKSNKASHKTKIDEAPDMIIDHIKKIEVESGVPVRCIRSDNGTEFRNAKLNDFCVEKVISRQYSAPRTPQQNGNRTLINRMYEKTPYELMANKKPSVKYFYVFGGKCYVLKDNEQIGKFDAKAEEGIFLGYSLESKAYRVFMVDDQNVLESLNITFDDTKPSSVQKEDDDESMNVEDFSDNEDELKIVPNEDNNGDDPQNDHNDDSDSDDNGGDSQDASGISNVTSETTSGADSQSSDSSGQDGNNSGGAGQEHGYGDRTQNNNSNTESSRAQLPRATKWNKSHPEDLIIGDPNSRVQTRRATANECLYSGFLSQMEPKKVYEALEDPDWKKYIKDLLTPAKTPMATVTKLDQDKSGKKVDITHYRGMIGYLLYLTASRPDIMFATWLCARFQADPKESHLIAVKRIFRYLKGTPNLGIWYPKDTGFDLIGYTDSDYARCNIDRKSTSGSCQFHGRRLVSWFSKKQHSVSKSTA
ncbi:uncharacterized protein LOC141686204 [Apium graveolens]|uniref:uncharacterized protein LOC141686204 n=1 Tax=Apium graveolens TaxID=4045 RepID=UPI003D7B1EE6